MPILGNQVFLATILFMVMLVTILCMVQLVTTHWMAALVPIFWLVVQEQIPLSFVPVMVVHP